MKNLNGKALYRQQLREEIKTLKKRIRQEEEKDIGEFNHNKLTSLILRCERLQNALKGYKKEYQPYKFINYEGRIIL